MKTIVLVSYHFPPAPEVGAHRAAKVAASFLARGWAVHVVAGPLQKPEAVRELPDGLLVERVPPSLDLRAAWLRLRGLDTSGPAATSPAAGNTAARVWRPPAKTSFLKRQISSAMWLPDDRQGWILPAARAAAAAVRSGAALLYSTAPPFSVHVAAGMTARRTGCPWVVEFRDPWTDNPWKPAFVRSAWSDAVERWLESRTLRAASLVVSVSEGAARRLRDRVPDVADRVIVVRNGIDRLADRTGDTGERPASVLYVGNLYHGRDPRPFLRAVAELRQQSGMDVPDIHFVGDCRNLLGESMEAAADALGLADRVHFVDPQPHAESLRRIGQADLLLLLAQDQPLQVPNKLYEYLAARKPILAFADADGETASMLHAVGGHFVIGSSEPADILETVRLALTSSPARPAPAAESLLREWTTGTQFDHLHAKLEKLDA